MKQDNNIPKVVCFGEVLWDMLPGGKEIGGAPLNVAYHLNKLGVDTSIISRVGQDKDGVEINQFIEKYSFRDARIPVDPIHPTSHVEVAFNSQKEITYDILKDVAWDYIDLDEAVKRIAKTASHIVFGSLATRSQVSRNTLFELINRIPVKIFDVNLRKPFYSKEIIQSLMEKSDIVKMNEEELSIISGWFNKNYLDETGLNSLLDKFNLKVIIVTSGVRGAALQSGKNYYFSKGYKTKVADTVGSGDAFLAGFISRYIRGAPLENTLEFANKMGALISQKNGGCPEYSLSEIDKL